MFLKKFLKIGFLALLVLVFQAVNGQNLYVATDGNDNNEGTLEKPLATLSKAKELVRKFKKNNALPKGGITIFIRGGKYYLNNTFELKTDDGGEAGKPIIYKAYQNEIPNFVASDTIEPKFWKHINEKTAKRVHPKVRPEFIVELDLSLFNFKNVKQFAPKNSFTSDWYIVDLLANGKRLPVAQWPNINENIRGVNDLGFTTCNGTKANNAFYFGKKGNPTDRDWTNELDLDGTNRSKRWQTALEQGYEIWLKGMWRTAWSPVTLKVKEMDLIDHSITFFEEVKGGMGSKFSPFSTINKELRHGTGKEPYYALNMLEEVDQPGEWALDFKDNKIYLYTNVLLEKSNLSISDQTTPIIKLNEVSHVHIEGLHLSESLGNGIELDECKDIVISGCDVHTVGNTGIAAFGGSDITISSNDIYETGGFGINVNDAGNRTDLHPSNVIINNNYIYHIGALESKSAINLSNCVGVTISHNLIHDTPKAGIALYNSNNCLTEYNEIHNIALKEGDTGALYNYGGWSTYGNVFRYNFIHHINRSNALYSDDGDSGDLYMKNIIYDCVHGVMFGGGHDLVAINNIFINSRDQRIDDRGKLRSYKLGTKYEENLSKFFVTQSPWKEYGEKLAADFNLTTKLWEDILNPDWHPELPNGCQMKNNVAVASGKFTTKTGFVQIKDNAILPTIEEAQFKDVSKMNLKTDNSLILEKFPELNKVFDNIGLQKDKFRPKVPTLEDTGGLKDRKAALNIDFEDRLLEKD